MIVLGLTGSVGMGKSTTAAMFDALGVPVFDADAEVHALYAPGGAAVLPVQEAFGDVLSEDGGIDREKLRKIVLRELDAMRQLERIIHPLTTQAQQNFRKRYESAALCLLDIPLLFEVGSDSHCDYVAVVSAPLTVQKARVLARPGMDEASFEAILAKQMPDAEKRARADFVISTAFGPDFTRSHVALIHDLMNNLS